MDHVGFLKPICQKNDVVRAMQVQEEYFTFNVNSLSVIGIDTSDVSEASEPEGEVCLKEIIRKLLAIEKFQQGAEMDG